MSHWGPDYGEMVQRFNAAEEAEKRRKAHVATATELLDRVLSAIRATPQRNYSLAEVMAVSPSQHADSLRADIEAAVLREAHSINVDTSVRSESELDTQD